MFHTNSISELQRYLDRLRKQHKTIGFVPTMGALHKGHLSLIEEAKNHCDTIVVSIFVNPTQFGPNEDYEQYPRPLNEDQLACKNAKVDCLFSPQKSSIYPEKNSSIVIVPELSKLYCGKSRPDFFQGVCSVVTRLLNIVRPHTLFLGEKDYQQATILKRMIADLFIPTKTIVCPIIREDSGLALSSRNSYLSSKEKKEASSIYQGLIEARKQFKNGIKDKKKLYNSVTQQLAKSISIDYLELVDSDTLSPLEKATENSRFLFAGTLGSVRLIDNLSVT